MIIEFKTKRDRCGNIYTLVLDTEKKTYNQYAFPYKDMIQITRKQRTDLIEKAKQDGYVHV